MSVDAILSMSGSLSLAARLGSSQHPRIPTFDSDTLETLEAQELAQLQRPNLLNAPSFQSQLDEFIQKLKLENERLLFLGNERSDDDENASIDTDESADAIRANLLSQSQASSLAAVSLEVHTGLNLLA